MQLGLYLTRHLQAALNSFGKLSRSPFSTVATCLIIGIALALPTALFVVLKNAETISGSFQQTMQVTLYLKENITASQVQSLVTKLETYPMIKKVQTISPAEGLIELQKQAGFDNSLQNLPNNPLPWVLVVFPREFESSAYLEKLHADLKQLPEVDHAQLDMLWVKRLNTLVKLAHRATYALAGFLGIAVVLIVNNTIRSATEWHSKEIELIQLIGGTNAFIRRPFIYTGMIYGLLGSITAWQLVDLFIKMLNSPVKRLAALYDSPFQLQNMATENILLLLISSTLLGLIGSWVAVTRHLHDSLSHQKQ